MNKNAPKVYICIPITGNESESYRQAALLEEKLNAMGYQTQNPHTICEALNAIAHRGGRKVQHHEYMAWCLPNMLACDIVCTCEGWENSKGCKMEVQIARFYPENIEVIHFVSLLKTDAHEYAKKLAARAEEVHPA